MRPSFAARAAAAASTLLLLPMAAHAAVEQSRVTSQSAVTWTPQLVKVTDIDRPRIDAISVADGRAYAGGRFERVAQWGTARAGFGNLMAFSATTGVLDTGFKPQFNGPVRAVQVAPGGSVFVGGDFTTVNGRTRPGLVKLTAGDEVDTGFKPWFGSGKVNDLELATIRGRDRLIVAGTMKDKLASVNTRTGANTRELDAVFTQGIPGARGGVSVFSVAVSPTRPQLVATGNFTRVTVDGVSRARRAFVMLDLPTTARDAAIHPWYYPGFAKECSATTVGDARRIANLQGIDWSPNGNFFNVAATGKIPIKGDVWHAGDTAARNAGSTVCDAVGRFALANAGQAVWINYSGGDSMWTVQDTGAAVYVQGHMQWLDNADGFASRPAICTRRNPSGTCIAGIGDTVNDTPASRRVGVGAINPATGRAFAGWDPFSASRMGGKALVARKAGVWWGSDSLKWNGKPRYGLAFTPTPR